MIKCFKQVGETPLECLERVRRENNISSNTKMTYAGRLDPLATGEMIILVGDECKDKDKYLHHDKVYEVEILLGISSDTFDQLGICSLGNPDNVPEFKDLKEYLDKHPNSFLQKYPLYSSKSFAHDRSKVENEASSNLEHLVIMYEVRNIETETRQIKDIVHDITERINKVKGDFRQDRAILSWTKINEQVPEDNFTIIKCEIHSGPGFYVRSFASDMGKHFGCGAIALKINRTKIEDPDSF